MAHSQTQPASGGSHFVKYSSELSHSDVYLSHSFNSYNVPKHGQTHVFKHFIMMNIYYIQFNKTDSYLAYYLASVYFLL